MIGNEHKLIIDKNIKENFDQSYSNENFINIPSLFII